MIKHLLQAVPEKASVRRIMEDYRRWKVSAVDAQVVRLSDSDYQFLGCFDTLLQERLNGLSKRGRIKKLFGRADGNGPNTEGLTDELDIRDSFQYDEE